jgi:hypothetical protein
MPLGANETSDLTTSKTIVVSFQGTRSAALLLLLCLYLDDVRCTFLAAPS